MRLAGRVSSTKGCAWVKLLQRYSSPASGPRQKSAPSTAANPSACAQVAGLPGRGAKGVESPTATSASAKGSSISR